MCTKDSNTAGPARLRSLACLALVLATTSAHAAQREWIDINGGLFGDLGNWSPVGGPRNTDLLLFKLGATPAQRYTVGNVKGEVDRLLVGNDALTFDFNDINTLRLLNTNATTPGLVIGQGGSGNIGDLVLTKGGSLVAHDAVLADDDGITGRLTSHGTAITLSHHLVVGKRGSGHLTLDGGAKLDVAGDALLGDQAIAHGTVQMSGEGSHWRNTGDIAIGFRGTGTASVLEGADVVGNNNTVIGHQLGAHGELTVRGAGASWTTREMHVGYFGSGTLTLDGGATLATQFGVLGTMAGAQGSAVVDGAQSHWSTDTLLAGYAGRGTLSITNGGTLSNRFGYIGDQLGGDGLVTVTGADSLWSNDEFLHIGQRSKGVLNILAGGTVSAKAASLGWLAGSNGMVNVDGAGALFDVDQLLELGAERDGTLRVTGGAKVNSGSAQLGIAAAAHGSAEVDGENSAWVNDGNLTVGEAGTGSVAVRSGGLLDVSVGVETILGRLSGSHGTITIDGPGSKLDARQLLTIGGAGNGALNIVAGGTVTTGRDAYVGREANGTGVVLVQGQHSRWDVHDGLWLGLVAGSDGKLDIRDGAQVTSSAGVLTALSGAHASVSVDGVDSLWSTGALYLGYLGAATLNIVHGGTVSAASLSGSSEGVINLDGGTLQLRGSSVATSAINLQSDGGTIEVTDPVAFVNLGSPLTGSGGLSKTGAGTLILSGLNSYVGDTAVNGGTLRIGNGGSVTPAAGIIAGGAGSNASLEVRGPTTRWQGSRGLVVGGRGHGTLLIDGGGQVFSQFGTVADEFGASGSALVSGSNARWVNTNSLKVGFFGLGALTIEQGGQVTNTDALVGAGNTGLTQSSEVVVRDQGSSWQIDGDLRVGILGRGRVALQDGSATVARDLRLGTSPLGTGLLEVAGANATLSVGRDLWVGEFGVGDVKILDGAELTSGFNALIGAEFRSHGSMVVDGKARWSNAADIAIGFNGTGDMQVSAGGQVAGHNNTIVGHQATGEGNLSIDGVGSSWSTNEMHVGYSGVGAMQLTSGALVTSTSGVIGTNADGRGNATVSGTGSEWDAGSLFVGYDGVGALSIEDGGRVFGDGSELGRFATGSGTVRVRGAHSTWVNFHDLLIGVDGHGTLSVENGGVANNLGASIADQLGSSGEVTVSAARWINRSGLNVGRGGHGVLTISDGGRVSDTIAVVGNLRGASGTVRVLGANSLWSTSSELHIGFSGQGRVEVRDGARLTSDAGMLGSAAGGVGQVVIDGAGAQWQVTNTLTLGAAGSGSIDVTHGGALRVGGLLSIGALGTLNLSDGLIDADTLAIDGGAFDFNGGRLQVTRIEGSLQNLGGTLAPGHSPGHTEVTGDYAQGAAGTLEIELASATSFDVLTVDGTAHLDGTLTIKLNDGFDAELGSHFDFLLAGQGIVGAFAEVLAPTWHGKRLLLDTSNDRLLRLTVAAVPLPSTLWLLASAMVMVGVCGQRRGQAHRT